MSTRSYGQYCGLARALDVVGNRWNLLIVRELLIGPARYRQLQAGLPGIATNLLAERLRELEEAGVIERQLDSDSNGVAYALTPWGTELRGTVAALVNWSKPLMISGPQNDSFQPHWLVVALESLLQHKRTRIPSTIGIGVDDATFAIRIDQTGPHVTRVDANALPETTFHAEPMVVLGLAAGLLPLEQAISAGVVHGDEQDLAAVFGPG
ncbi:winged helix-turn-helix transcriptional regulator [Mycolicibacterium fluoranthenivorans]|uniref:DNA-binding HxlR family transcriptional regulator n=1 Tax=Mycolicibacterium fluoranthenivorans TaxID=258505 RepID=A0A7X5TZS0_9MYCO|nr:helix-turn-helix domain-containing protein [Mycolicibacterium fluoranthenivorans]MCV7358145.1 helix-turn-helix transcriptional regulator [Mycolicibacterium fluoranthenivorans]NIH95735.1 DNA-binding HxlR family transcriptional regulator [Mycolicibacterium fluoranthenivorans]